MQQCLWCSDAYVKPKDCKICNPGSLEICASKYISATPLLCTLLHISRQFQSEMSSEWL